MKVTMYDVLTGKPRGDIDIPDDVREAAARVYHWMRSNCIEEFQDLQIRKQPPPAP